jgi:DNA-binding transcriptional LysR family regulator
VGSYPDVPPEYDTDFLFEVPVAAAGYPLAVLPAPIAQRGGAPRAIDLERPLGADLGVKHAFLHAGLGWGGMPRHMVQDELASGALVELSLEASPVLGHAFSMYACWRKDAPPGPAGRRFIELLRQF